ncbi:hypothetical protein GCK32_017582 [Trichostrongylus colubriformis]|uniref:Uncharacterized protein n=1 Tax=Trichostrongylus colubriformis TaxID=6319 RepID=A0AAN8FYR8_TRICO
MVPFYTFLLPVMTMFFLMKVKRTRRSNIQSMVQFFFPLTEVIWAYEGEKFEAPQISCLNTPVTRTKQINVLFTFAIICHIIAIFAIITVFLSHRHRSSTSHTLTSRFQFSENIMSSRLLITLSTLQLVIFLTYALAMMYLRISFNPAKVSLPVFKANVMSAYLVPFYTFLLPVIAMFSLERVERTRRSNIQSMVQIKSSGNEGWANYSAQLQQQWS